jgi:hypothetical protein
MAEITERLDLLLSPRDKATLAELAKRDGVSMGAVIRRLIAAELETELQGASAA